MAAQQWNRKSQGKQLIRSGKIIDAEKARPPKADVLTEQVEQRNEYRDLNQHRQTSAEGRMGADAMLAINFHGRLV